MDEAIAAEGLRKVYQTWLSIPRVAVSSVDLSVARGAMFGLIGPNGAGKTTFIKLLLGIVRPTAGRVTIFGRDPNDPRARRKVGYLPERLYIPPAFTLQEYVSSVARMKGVAPADAHRQIDRVGLSEERRTRVGRFSKGMRQRAGLAGAMVGEPELLVLDEPTDGIDPLGRKAVRTLLAEERQRGATVLLNSHLLDETERLCDTIAILNRGHVVREGGLDALALDDGIWRLQTEAPLPAELVSSLGLEVLSDNVVRLRCPSVDDANRALDRIRAEGGLVVSFSRDYRSLENILEEAIQ